MSSSNFNQNLGPQKVQSSLEVARGFIYDKKPKIWGDSELEQNPLAQTTSHNFARVYRQRNEDVDLDYIHIKSEGKKPMIVLHGLLGSKVSLRPICNTEQMFSKRDCYLVELRNHANSDHHDDTNYEVLSDDIIRFADKHGLEKFTICGHSLGGRTAMTLACRYPDRVDGAISIDSAPINNEDYLALSEARFEVAHSLMGYMRDLTDKKLTRKQAIAQCKKQFKRQPETAALLIKFMDRKTDELELLWQCNVESLLDFYSKAPFFDVNLSYEPSTVYHLVAEKGLHYDVEDYQKVFKNLQNENFITVKGAGHWIQDEKPQETLEYLVRFLDDIDQKSA